MNSLAAPFIRRKLQILGVVTLILLFSVCASMSLAGSLNSNDLDWFSMLQGLLFGLVVFLFGMGMMGEAMRSTVGDQMKNLLQRLTTNRIKGLLTGLGVTAIIQSSSVTTVMLVSFVSVGLMSFSRTIPPILGADVGTTLTAQLVAFKITHLAPLLCILGFSLFFRQRIRGVGEVIFGLGLVLFGMDLMGSAMQPLRNHEPFMEMMIRMDDPMLGIMIAAGFTALVQSSSATMGVVIAMAMQGVITLEAGIALALGANIGTCVTAGLAAIGKSREAVRVAVTHVLIKIVGVVVLLPFIPVFADFIVQISPHGSAAGTIPEAVPRQVANAHTVFNVGIALLFLPFTDGLARLVERLVPIKPGSGDERFIQPLELPESLIRTSPGMAIEAVRREIFRIGKLVREGMQKDVAEAMI